jgi:hypothetical protein
MNQRFFKLFTVIFILMGCAANQKWINATPEQRKVIFESDWNSNIGKPYVPYKTTILSVTDVQDGKREFIIRQLNDCKIGLLIENQGNVLLSWRYVSDPANCSTYYYTPGA